MTVNVNAPEPRLEHIFDMHVDLEPPQAVGSAGNMRQIFVATGGRVEGPRLNATILAGGGDWAIMRPDGALQLDVRATVRTDDGALIYTWYSGLIVGTLDVLARAITGQNPGLNEYYFYISAMFQTGDERYTWLNKTVALGRGKAIPNGVEYRVWAVENP